MSVARLDNTGGSTVAPTSAQAALDVADAFFSLLDAAEGGALDAVPALRQLVADSDDASRLMEVGDPALALRFDAVVRHWKEACS